MKRSSQVLLVLMGVTTTTAVGHYLAPPRTECVQQAPQARPDNQALPPCKNTSSTRLGSRSFWGSSGSHASPSSSSSEHTTIASSQISAPGATRGGFGSTGHGISSSS
jgi:hypothetical protein